jgi:LysM repeat protein
VDAPRTYTVKSGDTLTKVATAHKTTVKALRAANNLKTDAIKVGQKLTIPTPPAPAAP